MVAAPPRSSGLTARGLRVVLERSRRSAWSASFDCLRDFIELTGVDVVDVAVNRNVLGDQRMLSDPPYVLNNARGLVFYRVPFHEMAHARAMPVSGSPLANWCCNADLLVPKWHWNLKV